MSEPTFDIVGDDGQHYGPFSVRELRSCMTEGRANMQSKVRAAGKEGKWQSLGEVLGSLSHGNEKELAAAILARGQRLKIGRALGEGWSLFKGHAGILIGAVFVYMLIMFVSGMVPAIGGIVQLCLAGPLTGGVFILALNLLRNEPAEFKDLFQGFERSFTTLLLVGIAQWFIAFLASLPGLIMVILSVFIAAGKVDGETKEAFGEFLKLFAVSPITIAGFFLLFLFSTIAYALIYFVLPLAADKDMGFSPSFSLGLRVSARNFLPILGLFVIGGCVIAISMLPLGLGLIVSLPWFFAVLTAAYAQMFCPESPPNEQ